MAVVGGEDGDGREGSRVDRGDAVDGGRRRPRHWRSRRWRSHSERRGQIVLICVI